jgi:alginate O-acetyltransferase complex protein AlgJ
MAALFLACATGSRFPWPAQGPAAPHATFARADVTTVNDSYDRATSQVLVRKISRPSRAALDYAAYEANFMNADPPPEGDTTSGGQAPHVSNPFGGKIVTATLTGSLASTPLTAEERAHPYAVAPLAELLSAKHIDGSDRFDDVLSAVRGETWGLPGGPQLVRQTAALAYLHNATSDTPELWLKIELAPWFKGFTSMPDDDGDGVPNVYGRASAEAVGDLTAIVKYVRDEYEGRTLTPTEVKGWAHQLASYWYPSYNTDLVPTTGAWPNDTTEEPIRQELHGTTYDAPTVVMRGKPMGKPVYNVFLVESSGGETASASPGTSAAIALPHSKPTPDPEPVVRAIKGELEAHGGTWKAWAAALAPFRDALKARLGAVPAEAKAFVGEDRFLFFRNSTQYILGGDLSEQKGDRNPVPPIVAFRKLLAHHDVDLLFVPVPTKEEVYPDKAGGAKVAKLAGEIVNPFERKFLEDLGKAGVETVDLLPAFLHERDKNGGEPLFQHQDTHWTSRGLEIAAKVLAARIKRYPWYKDLATHKRAYHTQDAPFTRHGDLVSRLPEASKAGFQPEALTGHQVLTADGQLYEDDPDSPVVLLGDSFTGVYELIDCEHAGVSAHTAKEIGYPLDLVMSYGGGPNVRQKLLRRGEGDLSKKKLVIWLMTARDLYDFHEGWEPLPASGGSTKAKYHKGK